MRIEMKNIYTVLNETYNEVSVFTKIKQVRDFLYSKKIELGYVWHGQCHDMMSTRQITFDLKINGTIAFSTDEKETETYRLQTHQI